ncbi:M50 family metallopeptidase [Faecalibacterium prausnitzii]|uniref:M50 family metallopeptidase n=1 Tax=Faecalibacterium prausnitzii TaxID=853 RepID=UPI0012DDA320|nr:site-2 protease family protein [Faecalibacterium prausnitzii]
MSFIVTFIAAVFVFSAVIAIHEFGHFMVAKLCGVQVNEFSIGMGPVLCKRVRKGTQYSIRALPVGGFVALEGEESPESRQAEENTDEEPLSPHSDADSSPSRGAKTDAGEPAAPSRGAKADVGKPDLPPLSGEVAEPTGSDGEVSPSGIPLNEAPVWQRALIMLAGAGMNFVLGFVVMAILITAQNEPITSKVLYQVEENALCGQTGLQAGDKILAVNGRRCFVANDILYELMRTEDYTADFTVLRDGKKVELPGVQFDTWQDDKGETHMSLGFTVYGIRKTPLNVLKEAGNSVLYYGRIIFASLSDLLRGRESINDLSGPVGIVTAIGQAASYGWQDLLELLVLITVNLGIFNLLPFPALDGGKVVFLLIEGVTGHAVPEKIQSGLTVAAFALLFGLMIFATYNDILRLITGAM